MGFDGILTSVFIPLEISPDANLMKKHRTAEIRRGRQRWGARPVWRGGRISAPPLALLSLADLVLVSSGIERVGSVSPSNSLPARRGRGD